MVSFNRSATAFCAVSTMSKNAPSRPSAVLSTTTMPSSGTDGMDPLTTSAALMGYIAEIFPISETCSRSRVPDRMDVATRMLELLCLNSSSSAASLSSGNRLRMTSGRLS